MPARKEREKERKMQHNRRAYRIRACTIFTMSIFPLLLTGLLLMALHVSTSSKPAIITARQAASSSSSSDSFDDLPNVSPAEESQLAAQDAAYSAAQSLASAPLAASDSAKLAAEFARWTASQAAAAAAAATPAMAPLKVVNEDAVDGITCVSKASDHGESFNSQDCAGTIQQACRKLNESRTGRYIYDEWVSSYNGDCAMSYWMPASVVNTSNVPSVRQCADDIFGPMVTGCGSQNGGKSAASINVAELPDGKGSTGRQADPGRISYLMAASPWRCDHGCSS